MITTVTVSEFHDFFTRHYDRADNFSYVGRAALYEYLTELEESCDMAIELDVIALCCEFTEYDSLDEIKEAYQDINSMDDLYEATQVIAIDGGNNGYIIQDF